jgi:hypothetical protein
MKTALAVLAAAVTVSVASADVVQISSNGFGQEGLGAFTGWVSYSPGLLTISLTNDASTAAGGKITGVAFNIDGNASATLVNATHPAFAGLGTNISAPPLGTFDAGAAMGGSWTGGGSPNAGITVGSTGEFEFSVSGPDAGSLTAASFVQAFPDVSFVVRFRGFANGGSDKTPGYQIPAPAALSLLGVAGLLFPRRRARA